MHTSDVVRVNQGSEPFDICQEMRECSKMGWQLEDGPYLSNAEPWDVGLLVSRCSETRNNTPSSLLNL